MTRIAVFCGSSSGAHPAYADSARRVGALLARRGLGLVYGGAGVGTMRALADAALEAGGHVTGVIPAALVAREIAHGGLPDLRIVATMHERKAVMASLADAFIALPGGIGTLEETCEIFTWAQLGLHAKPCGLLDVRGYYRGLVAFLEHAVAEGFLREEHRSMVFVEEDPDTLLARFAEYAPPRIEKWIRPDQV